MTNKPAMAHNTMLGSAHGQAKGYKVFEMETAKQLAVVYSLLLFAITNSSRTFSKDKEVTRLHNPCFREITNDSTWIFSGIMSSFFLCLSILAI